MVEAIRQQAQEGDAPVGAIVIDTLSRALGCADENGEGMAAFIENAGIIEKALGCVVAPVHHTGWDVSRMRGWSGLHGADDVEWAVSKKEGKHEVHVQKMKDGEDGLKWQFAFKVVPVGLDEDNDVVTTCVVNLQIAPAEGTEAAAVDKAAVNRKAEDVFMKLFDRITDLGFLRQVLLEIRTPTRPDCLRNMTTVKEYRKRTSRAPWNAYYRPGTLIS